MKRILICCVILGLAGCEQRASQTSESKKESGVSDAVDTVVIQRGKMDAGRRAADQIKKINASRESDLREVAGE